MAELLQPHASRLRSALEAGDFDAGRAALAAYASELERAARSCPDRVQLSRLEQEWNDLLVWTRSVAVTSREVARGEWARLQHVSRYTTPTAEPDPPILTAMA